MPGFQPYTIPAKKPFYHIVMKQISFLVKSGLLLVAFMTFSGYGKAQISIENSADDKVEIKKVTPKTDGSTNIYFPTDISRNDYDTSLDAQIEYYKAFIGQRILFYAGAIGFQPIKPHIIRLHQPFTQTFTGKENFIGKKKKTTYTIRNVYTRGDAIQSVYLNETSYGVEGNCTSKIKEEYYSKQFFTLVNVLTPWEADQILDDNSMHPAELPLDMQKKLQKIKKKMEGKRDWDELQSLSHLFITQTDDGETVFSQTVKGDTLIDEHRTYSISKELPIFLIANEHGEEYLVSSERTWNWTEYITENHLNYLKQQYVGYDFAKALIPSYTHYRCVDIVLRDKKIVAKCRIIETPVNTMKSGDIVYLKLSHELEDGEMNWQLYDGYLLKRFDPTD